MGLFEFEGFALWVGYYATMCPKFITCMYCVGLLHLNSGPKPCPFKFYTKIVLGRSGLLLNLINRVCTPYSIVMESRFWIHFMGYMSLAQFSCHFMAIEILLLGS